MAVNLKSTSARDALKPRRNPYFHCLRIGLYVGYRRADEGTGTWIARRLKEGTKSYEFRSLGTLSGYEEAVRLTEAWAGAVDMGITHKAITVDEVCNTWVTHKKTENSKASAADVEGRFNRLVHGKPIGAMPLDKLRTNHLREWLVAQLNEDGDEDDMRRSKNTANRNLAAVKAALNLALKDRLILTDAGWKTVTPYPKASKRRTGDLTSPERAVLLAHCDIQLAALVRTLLLTALRPGEIANANVGDLNKEQGTLTLTGKTGRRLVTLSTTAIEFLKIQAQNKLPSAPLLTDSFGNRWNKDSWKKRFKNAVKAAKLPDEVVMYTLRHVAISEMIAGGVDTFLVARLAGTSTTMIDKHYGHLRHIQTRARLDAVEMI
ncbi:Site-specific recombinase XerD [Polaromonas sp. OV174]|uniref:tyrosine-type recombinase/integrase n=1 Tax=Polaromonas sp. OV174 TaxID=1855300 RepID=UPI0008E3A766|nr:site-specific integrase [Polaromonas sp. OV174]SFC34039.1 Site-specific recombinase XerD [Polaromonas sp. OV174]